MCMNKIRDLNQYKDDKHAKEKVWATDEVMCLCGKRWFAVYDYRTPLHKFECPSCEEQGKVFRTGQDLEVLK